ncbi:MAG: PKD domain-containing protein [Halovenus sp.]
MSAQPRPRGVRRVARLGGAVLAAAVLCSLFTGAALAAGGATGTQAALPGGSFQVAADCTLSDTEAPPGTSVTLDASGSQDSSAYEYDKEGDGIYDSAYTSAETYTFEYQETGTYTPTVKAWSGDQSDTVECGTLVIDENQDPDAVLETSPANPEPGQTVTFDPSGTTDPDGDDIVEYQYDLSGDPEYETFRETDEPVSRTYDQPGTYTVDMRARDEHGAYGYTSVNITVAEANDPPSAFFTYDPQGPTVGETVTFDARESTDPDGTITEFRWDFDGDGAVDESAPGDQPTATHSYASGGSYDAVLTVVDDDGAIDQYSEVVEVREPTRLSCTVAPGTVRPGEDVTVDATESEGIDTVDVDIDGDERFELENVGLRTTYQYEETGTYTVIARADTGGTEGSPRLEFATCGDVTVDAADQTLPDDMTVTVTDPWTDFTEEETTVTFETSITADGQPYQYGEYGSPNASHFEVTIGGASVPTEDLTVTERAQDRYTVEAVVPVESIRGYGLDVAFTDEKAGTEATVRGSSNVLVPVLEAMEGTGTRSAPYVVTNATELQAIDADRDGHVRLGNDVDASETEAWFGGSGFIPIGAEDEGFNATFDGDGNTISGLTIDRDGRSSVGMFHAIGASGVIENVTLAGVDVVGEGTTGALAATSRGTVRWSGATGEVVGGRDTGGLVGDVVERSNSDSVFRSWAAVNVTGGYATGGLVGYNGGGRIVESFATGDVDGGQIVGGLVGYNYDGVIAKSYAQGDVHGDRRVAGLVGENQHAASTPGGGIVNETYATGRVTATEELTGGLVATETIAEIENSYWDTEATGQEVALGMDPDDGNYLAGKLRTAEMTGGAAESNMSDFDFDNTWRTVEGDYPRLQWADGIDDVPPPATETQVTDTPSTADQSPPDPEELPLPPAQIGGGILLLAGLGGGYYLYRRRSGGSDSRPPRPPRNLPEGNGIKTIDTGTFLTAAGSGTVRVNGLGFEPDLILLSATTTARAGGDGSAERSDGWAHGRVYRGEDGQLLQSTMALADDGYSLDGGMGGASDGHALELLVHYDDSPERLLGTVSATTSDGFEMSVDADGLRGDRADAQFTVLYKAFAFSGDPQVEVGHFRTPDAPGTQSVEFGVDADHVMLFATNTVDDVDSHVMTDLPLGFSVGDVIGRGSPAQLVRTATVEPSVPGTASYAAYDDRALHLLYGYDGRVRGRTTARVTNLGERMDLEYESVYTGPNKLGSTDGKLVSYVAMNTGGVQPAVGFFQLPAPGDDGLLAVDLGFQPSMVKFQTFGLTEVNTETTVDSPFSFGWSEGTVIPDAGHLRHQVLDEAGGPTVPSPGSPALGVAASVRTVADGGRVTGRDDVTVTAFTETGFEMLVTDLDTGSRDGDDRPYVFYKAWPLPVDAEG